MALEWADIVLYRGSAATGDFRFDYDIEIPPPLEGEPKATSSQIDGFERFFRMSVADLTGSQAHACLSYRNYARSCTEVIFKAFPAAAHPILALCLAAYISHSPEVAEFAINWSDRAFARGVSSPRVKGSPAFYDIQAFADYLVGVLEMDGWVF